MNLDLVSIGTGTYGTIDMDSWNNPDERLIIGKYCSIASEVKFILGGNHDHSTLSSYPFSYLYENKIKIAKSKGPIIVEDGVWIGTRATILSGVTIGKGAVIAACCVVSKSVPPYAIVAGNPMKIIKYRFSEDIRERLIKLDYYQKITKSFYMSNSTLINNPLSEDLIKILENNNLSKL